jgi:uncharacterized protein (DUF1800 family)
MSEEDTTPSEWQLPEVPAPVVPDMATPEDHGQPSKISRRHLIIGAGAVGVGAVAITSGVVIIRGALNHSTTPAKPQQIAHLLRRAGFGAGQSELHEYNALGFNGAIDRLINYSQVQDDVDVRLKSLNLDLTKIADMQRGWLIRMIYSRRPLLEKMTLFWHGLLTSSYTKLGGVRHYGYLTTQNDFLRAHAFDTYDNILLGITSDPAMMWWLDLRLSQKNSPNENYARELMELFTIGVNGGYTQTDVHEAARALTGWQLKNADTAATYNPAQHDDGAKTLLGHTGNLDYHDVIRIVASHPATGPFLCRRLFSFFVHANPTVDELKPMIDAYNHSGHNIGSVMRAMLTSPAFIASHSYRARIKSPIEYLVGAVRQLGIQTNGQALGTVTTLMGQTLFNPPNVAGWPGDNDSAAWLNTGTWLERVNFINALLDTAAVNDNSPVQQALASQGAKTPEQIVDYFTTLMIDGQISNDRRQMLLKALGQDGNLQGIRAMLYVLMTGPEYQLN